MNFGEKLHSLMKENNLSNYALSKIMKCSQTSIQNWISGATQPQKRSMQTLADIFGVPLSYFEGKTDRYGIDMENWAWMGKEYQGFRERRGISTARAVDGTVVTEEELIDFEENGTPLLPRQLIVICGLIGADPTYVFAAWKDFLWPDDGIKKAPVQTDERETLTEDGRHIGVLYDRAAPADQVLTHRILDKYDDDAGNVTVFPTKSQNPGDFVELDVYDEPAAAGFGNYLQAPKATREQFPAFMIPTGADFGIRISGRSMEPRIHDGSVVFVKHTIRVESGQLGIFILNGESFCKKLVVDSEKMEVRLRSLNPDYKDIVLSPRDVLQTVGKVL